MSKVDFSWEIGHMVNGFKDDFEQSFGGGGDNGPLARKIGSLASERKFRKMVSLGEHVQR
jgi:hypothetical protein